MSIILIVGFLLLIVSFLKRDKYSLYIGFAFVFLIMGFQSNVQGDYYGYLDSFEQIRVSGKVDTRTVETEPFYPFLMKLLSFGPWWLFLAVTSFFQTTVLAIFVRKYANKSYQWVAAIMFFFTFNMMLLQMKAIRQAFSIELIIWAFLLMEYEIVNRKTKQKKWHRIPWLSLLVTVLAYYTHNTVLVLVPFLILYWWALKRPEKIQNFGNGELFPWIMVGVYAIVCILKEAIFKQYLESFVLLVISNSDSQYMSYIDGSSSQSFQNQKLTTPLYYLVFYGSIVYFAACSYQKSDSRMRVFCLAAILGAIGEILFFSMGSLPRIIMGLSVFSLVVIPNILYYIKHKYGPAFALGYFVLAFFMLAKISIPWMLQTTDGRFGTYKFIFMQ